MEIRFLSLRTANLSETHRFYVDLGLPNLGFGQDYTVFQVGATQLMFEALEEPEDDSRPFYHFAFDVPRNRLESAAAWLGERVDLLERDGETRFHFDDWNADSVYFHDPSGSIVELIARHNLVNDTEEAFTPQHLLRVSEIGWPVFSIEYPETDFQLPAWRDYDSMKVLGSETGLILLVPNGRPWLPTGRPAEAHPSTVVIADEKGSRSFRRL